MTMNILVADDHPMVLKGLSSALTAAGHKVTAIASLDTLFQQLTKSTEHKFHLLLLDYHFPDGKVIDILKKVSIDESAIDESTIVAILSGMTDPEEILNLLEVARADLFISKTIDIDDLLNAVSQLEEKKPEVAMIWNLEQKKFLHTIEQFPKGTVLSPKEREVFMLLKQGMLDKQIAESLNRSIHTIRVQIRAIKRKRGSLRRTQI